MANGNGRQYESGGRRFFGMSRSEKRSNNILGVIQSGGIEKKHFRSEKLKKVDDYLNNIQYDHLANWDESCYSEESYIRLKERKPKLIVPFAKMFKDRVGGKLCGASTFPKTQIEEDPDAEYFLSKVIIPSALFKPKMLSIAKDLVLRTSAFLRFKIVDGSLQLVSYNTNYCYPEFDDIGELEKVIIKYVYDTDETDPLTGKMKKKWFKLELGKLSDIFYDNPDYNEKQDPEFQETERADHNLGFVQGEWFRIGENQHNPDGDEDPIIYSMMGFIDAINYNLSLSDQATNYGAEPQLVVTGVDQEEADKLIKSATKSWLLGMKGEARFLETSNSGVENSKNQRDNYLQLFQHIARIVLLDPEKMVGSAQSAKAMEVLHGPLVEMINEVRPWVEKGMVSVLKKMLATILILTERGFETIYMMPEGWTPQSLDISLVWPPIFELTTQDMQQIVSLAMQASSGNVISRDTALRWIQSQGVNFGVEDYELEQQKVNTQQQFNTFF